MVERAKTRPPKGDEAAAARATIRSACVAAEQRFSRSGGNPIHVWEAVWMCTQPAVAPMPLPPWCSAYLHQASQALLAAVQHNDTRTAVVSQALGFTRGGWSASKAFASAAKATRAAIQDRELRDQGMSAASAYEEVRKHARLGDADSARKLYVRASECCRTYPHIRGLIHRSG